MVYFHHCNPFNKGTVWYNIASELHIGVTFFFVLSGFLIAHRYAFTKINFKSFIFNRLARIYPMYFLVSSLFFANYLYHNVIEIKEFIKLYILNITFIKGFSEYYKFTGVAQGWTLTVEELFYLLSPVFFYYLEKQKRFFIILPIILILIGSLLVEIFTKFPYQGYFVNYEYLFNYSFFGRCIEFFIGIGLAFVLKYSVNLKINGVTYIGVFFSIVSLLFLVYLKGDYDFGIQHPLEKVVNTFILPLFGIALIYYGLIKENTIITKILSLKIFEILGKSSYIFYLIHIGIIHKWISQYTNSILLKFVLLNIISIIFYFLLEKPIHSFLMKKFYK